MAVLPSAADVLTPNPELPVMLPGAPNAVVTVTVPASVVEIGRPAWRERGGAAGLAADIVAGARDRDAAETGGCGVGCPGRAADLRGVVGDGRIAIGCRCVDAEPGTAGDVARSAERRRHRYSAGKRC